ncbi:tetratricopeptide repeat protein [Bdellovibrio sp. HCB337]|uniref:tetratricopeptide repeat protein n=1 Tax=Bdellovibrio sp. HCB337 TaxID=3394358 RepID=UPI0039A70F0A
MKKLLVRKFTKMLKQALIVGLTLGLSACSPPEAKDYKAAQEEMAQGHHRIALSNLDRVLKRAPDSEYAVKAARDGARISSLETKDYKKAASYYQFLVLHSPDATERLNSQKQLAAIYFDQLQNYDQAIIELNKLIRDTESDVDIARYKLDIARSNYYLNNFFQAHSELDDLLKLKVDDSERFSAWVLKSNIHIALKEYAKAIEILKKVTTTFPQKSLQENVYQTLAVCYEETDNFTEAINTLESVKDKYAQPEYIDIRIKRLKERQKNRPGARGLRK